MAWRRLAIVKPAIIGLTLLSAAACGSREAPIDAETACHGGGYRLDDGTVVGVIPRSSGDLRYQLMDGETGVVLRGEDGVWRGDDGAIEITLGACGDDAIAFQNPDGRRGGVKIPYQVQETVFEGVDGERAGRLVLPAGGEAKAIIVSVHGSERWSGRTGSRLQTILPAFGVGVFAYDKRGTGASTGKYTQDFYLLAGDASRARAEAARLYGAPVEVGYVGGSQGGWVAPLAASQDGAPFVVAAYGMAEGPLAEDREEVVKELREKGYGQDVIDKAREITDATGAVMASGFKDGYDELNRVRKKYKNEPWYDEIEGEFTGQFLRAPNIGLRIAGPFLDVGTSWEYEPRPVLEDLEAPQLWILADEDRAAPSEKTLAILRDIQIANSALDIVVFPNTDHGIVEFETLEDGTRVYGDVADGYYALIRDYALRREVALTVDGPIVYLGSE